MSSGSLIALEAGQAGEAGFDLGDAYTLSGGERVQDVFNDPGDIVNIIAPNLFVIAGIALMILIIAAGYQYVAKGVQGAQEAMKILGAALAGFLVMFAAYWIVRILQMVTGVAIPL